MSRIDDALRRFRGGAAAVERNEPHLNRFSAEKTPKPDEGRKSAGAQLSPPSFPAEARPTPFDARPVSRAAAPPPPSPPVPVAPAAPASEDGEESVAAESVSVRDNEKLIDFNQLADYALFVVGATRRHKWLGLSVCALVLALTGTLVTLLPRTYHVSARLLAQRNEVMTALSNPGRAVPWDADAPTRAAAETVLRRDNLIAIIKETDLLADWERTRAPLLKFKDVLTNMLGGPLTPEEKLDQMVGLLESRIIVVAGPTGDGTVSIDLDWPHAEMAFLLVEAAQKSFLEARQAAEAAAINESIGILERYSATLHENISGTMAELERAQKLRRVPATRTARATSPRLGEMPTLTSTLPPIPDAALGSPALSVALDDPEISKLKAAATAKRQEIANLEQARQRQLGELQAKLGQLTTIYTHSHPTVVALQQNITTVSHDTPELINLRASADRIEAEYSKRVAAAEELQEEERRQVESKPGTVAAAAPPARQQQAHVETPSADPQNATLTEGDFASVRLRLELNQLESVLERTDGARIELAVSQAAFKYRYTVIKPAQVPRSPVRPNVSLVMTAGLMASLMLALVAVVGRDLFSNRILEPWQVERQLGLPVLGTLGHA